jgi:transposase
MISIASSTRIFVATSPTDMRKGFDGLQGLVAGVLGQDPLSGHLFLFVNRRRDKLKVLYWDGDGLAIWYRRLEQGTFQMPSITDDQTAAEINREDLLMLIRGLDYENVQRRKRYKLPDSETVKGSDPMTV